MTEPDANDMNLLQLETTLISDNCVTWADVAEVDRERALEWLWKRKASAGFVWEQVHQAVDKA